jgi:hypothetical protein
MNDEVIAQLSEAREERLRLVKGGGGNHTGGMDHGARIAKLEDAVGGIRVDLAEIKGKLSNMPTTWGLALIVIGLIFTVMGGALGIVKLLHP